MKRVSEGGEGITRHEIIGDGANAPSPVGRIIATFEPERIPITDSSTQATKQPPPLSPAASPA
ncbi:MAG: hypothetical protein Q9198_006895 [Flavoplaca austrocitrina]